MDFRYITNTVQCPTLINDFCQQLERMSDQFLLDILVTIPVLLVWLTFPDMAAAIVHAIGDRTMKILYELPYSRVLENEADEVGMKLSAKVCEISFLVIYY